LRAQARHTITGLDRLETISSTVAAVGFI